MTSEELERQLRNDIMSLNRFAWDNRAGDNKVNRWLANFEKEDQLLALFALHQFLFYGRRQLYHLLKTAYEEVKSSLIRRIRQREKGTKDIAVVRQHLEAELYGTRFVGMGPAGKSGQHVLYQFRKTNKLPERNCMWSSEMRISSNDIWRYIFIDDLAASGEQACTYSAETLAVFSPDTDCEFWYIPLLATKTAQEKILRESRFHRVQPVVTLDETFRCFGDESRLIHLAKARHLDWANAKVALKKYKARLGDLRGFGKAQLLLGFEHGVPNNTIPIFWAEKNGWFPIFPRVTDS